MFLFPDIYYPQFTFYSHPNTECNCVLSVPGAPDPPIEVQVISCHGKSAEIVWQAGPNNGDDISGFIIQYNTSESKDTWHDSDDRSLGEDQTAYVNLNPWGTYSFRVLAMNSVGISKPSKATKRSCTTPPERPYRNPDNVHTTTDKKGMLVIEWTVSILLSSFLWVISDSIRIFAEGNKFKITAPNVFQIAY